MTMITANKYGLTDCPMPGEFHNGGTVIASGWTRDEVVAVMTVIRPTRPDEGCTYRVEEIPLRETDEDGMRLTHWTDEYENIVPAARHWDELGLWGGS